MTGAGGAPAGAAEPVLGTAALGRALLARQHLLERATTSAGAMVRHLVGLQAQAVPDPPYLGLLSRLEGFRPEELSGLLESRAVVRIALMRSTVHLVTAEDCLALRPLVQPVIRRSMVGNWGRLLPGIDYPALAARARTLVEESPRTFRELGSLLAEDFPGYDPAALAQAARCELALVQPPPRGVWGRSGAAAHTTAEHWLGRPLDSDPSLDDLVLRYLAAFGPARAADVQKWSGLTGLTAVLKRLAPDLLRFRDERGRLLYDLPGAPRPAADTPAPVRLIAPFDNLILSHADRARVLPEEARRRVMTQNGLVQGTLLVDGLVVGLWRPEGEDLRVRPFRRLRKADRLAAEAEGARIQEFAGRTGPVVVEPPG
ncbi:winged helix DNA-binding domain-containing protein [Kitasatospora camelliae]|uniref:Winged helix DNA-binding domain-containing protein n=1 Tax=Kitasatospora camelliae TaxID=3156397 RepID=A0AAU8JQD8_9ACTN